MARKRAHIPLNVFLNSRHVGVLRREATGAIDFQYGRDWLDWRGTFPVSLSLPLREDRYIGAPVINVFDNLLPDSDPIRKRIAERVGADGADAFSLLTVLGPKCDIPYQAWIDCSAAFCSLVRCSRQTCSTSKCKADVRSPSHAKRRIEEKADVTSVSHPGMGWSRFGLKLPDCRNGMCHSQSQNYQDDDSR